MNKFFVVLSILIFVQIRLYAQAVVSYKDCDDKMLKGLMDFQGIKYFEIILHGNIKGKEAILVGHVFKNGHETVYHDLPSIHLKNKRNSIQVWAQATEGDSVKILLQTSSFGLSRYCAMRISDSPILMETYIPKDQKPETIPIIAFTPGLKEEMIINGEKYARIDYCKLRDARVHPAEWKEKFGLLDYLYFEIKIK